MAILSLETLPIARDSVHRAWLPATTGYYWASREGDRDPEIVCVFRDRVGRPRVSVGGRHADVTAFAFLSGPIDPSREE